jgi:hypothetical protein
MDGYLQREPNENISMAAMFATPIAIELNECEVGMLCRVVVP